MPLIPIQFDLWHARTSASLDAPLRLINRANLRTNHSININYNLQGTVLRCITKRLIRLFHLAKLEIWFSI